MEPPVKVYLEIAVSKTRCILCDLQNWRPSDTRKIEQIYWLEVESWARNIKK